MAEEEEMALEAIGSVDMEKLIEKIKAAEKTIRTSNTVLTPMTNLLGEHGLDNVDCDICGNTGWVVWKENDELKSKECSCMAKRRSLRRLKQSGMEAMFERYTFDNYEAKDKYRAALLGRAKDYVEDTKGWFYIAGTSGSGKTHICTAICKAFIDKGVEVYYMNWRDESVALKNDLTNGDSYSEKIKSLLNFCTLMTSSKVEQVRLTKGLRLRFSMHGTISNSERLYQVRLLLMDCLTLMKQLQAESMSFRISQDI